MFWFTGFRGSVIGWLQGMVGHGRGASQRASRSWWAEGSKTTKYQRIIKWQAMTTVDLFLSLTCYLGCLSLAQEVLIARVGHT